MVLCFFCLIFLIKLELGKVAFLWSTGVPGEKLPGARARTNNKQMCGITSGNQTLTTLMGGEHPHHCTTQPSTLSEVAPGSVGLKVKNTMSLQQGSMFTWSLSTLQTKGGNQGHCSSLH